MAIVSAKRDRSYPLVHPELVEASMVPAGHSQWQGGGTAELRELSAASGKLLVPGPPELPFRCRLRLVSSKLPRTLEIPAEVNWARPNLAGDWLVECEFDSRFNEQQFAKILDSGLLERRSSVRVQTRIDVRVQWKPEGPSEPGTIRDLSEGGLCLLTVDRPQHTREVFLVVATPTGEKTLRLKVRWSLPVGDNQMIGCQFFQIRDFHVLRNLPSGKTSGLTEFSRATRPS